MAMTFVEKLRKKVEEKVMRQITFKSWSYQGGRFITTEWYRISRDVVLEANFCCDLKQLSAAVSHGSEFDGTLKVLAERKFQGENAIEDCIQWTVDALIESDKKIQEIIAPYVEGKARYEMALKGKLA